MMDASLTLVDTRLQSNHVQTISTANAGAGGIYSERSSISMHSIVESRNDAVDEIDGHCSSNSFATGLYALSPVRAYIIDTTFEAFDDALSALIVPGVSRGTMRGSCQEHPCAPGYGCKFHNASLTCLPCSDTTYSSDGIECTMCPAGEGPLADGTGCSQCVGNNFSSFGVCSPCVGTASDNHAVCSSCPSGQIPTPDSSGCQCELDTYNATQGFITCSDMDHDPDSFDADPRYMIARDQWIRQDMQCLTCPSCVDCMVSPIRVRPGFGVANVQETGQKDTANKTLLRCRPETAHTGSFGAGELASSYDGGAFQCIGGSLANLELGCATGHEGLLCGVCSEGYGRKNENECHKCDSAVDPFQVIRLLGVTAGLFFVIGLIIIGLSFVVGDVYEDEDVAATDFNVFNPLSDKATTVASGADAVSHAKLLKTSKRLLVSGAQVCVLPARIFLGYFQIAAHLEDVLHTEFPPLIADLFGRFKWLVVNINGIVALECAGLQDFHMIWLFEVIIVPLALCLVVGCYWLYRNYAMSRAYANTKAMDELFLVLFITYPFVTNKCFAVLNCRSLTHQLSVLVFDYSIDCSTQEHAAYQIASYILIAVFSVGVPVVLILALVKNNTAKRATFDSPKMEYVCRRMMTELGKGELSDVETVFIDIKLGSRFGSLINAFRPGMFFFEALDMLRKLACKQAVFTITLCFPLPRLKTFGLRCRAQWSGCSRCWRWGRPRRLWLAWSSALASSAPTSSLCRIVLKKTTG